MALKKEDAISAITEGISWVAMICKLRGLLHLFNTNVISHDFFCSLLNEIYGVKLEVMDRIKANFPAIDLGDIASGRAFQVTTEKGGDKVQATLDMFVKHDLHSEFGKIQILVIGDKQGSYGTVKVPAPVEFSVDDDIIDINDLIKTIESLGIDQLERVAEVVRKHLKTVKAGDQLLLGLAITSSNAERPEDSPVQFKYDAIVRRDPSADTERYAVEKLLTPIKADDFERVGQFVGRETYGPEASSSYNRELKHHLDEYSAWCRCLGDIDEIMSLVLPVKLWLVNRGNMTATDLTCTVRFPRQCGLVVDLAGTQMSVLDKPEAPQAPRKPSISVADFLSVGAPIVRHSVQLPDLGQFLSAINGDGDEAPPLVTFDAPQCRPGECIVLRTVALILRRRQLSSFDARYQIVGGNLAAPVTGAIRIEIS